jgi:hypothetical protein
VISGSRDSSVGIATGYGLLGRGSTPAKATSEPSRRPSQLPKRLLGVTQLRLEAEHASESSAEVKNGGAVLTTRNIKIIMFLGSKVRLVRRADNLTAICEPIV